MKKNLRLELVYSLLLAATPLAATAQTTFFTDTFGTSTLNSLTPAAPTATSTSYEMLSAKPWVPAPSIAPGHLGFGIAASGSGAIEAQALFASQPVLLTTAGDYIEMRVTFTDTSGLLTQKSSLGFGLYSSGGVAPISGGLSNTMTSSFTTAVTGGAQNWLGYIVQIPSTGNTSVKCGFYDRQAQSIAGGNNNQDVVSTGSGTQSYSNPAGALIGKDATTSYATLTAGAQYTEVLRYTLTSSNTLQLDNNLYSGSGTTGTLQSTLSTNTPGAPLTVAFDSFAFGWRSQIATTATTIDVNSITITGQSTPPGKPIITTQPVPVQVASNGACMFSVEATGVGLTYQWHRHGTNLLDAGNISGATSDTVVISQAGSADVASAVNGYFVTVTGTGNQSVNSTTNSLALIGVTNLVYSGSGPWDLNTSASWLNSSLNPGFYFNYGDSVTFDDNGGGGIVTLTGAFLAAPSVTVNSSSFYTFQGTGSFAGPGSLIYKGSAQLTINNSNIYSGGTLVSNATANLRLGNLNGLGTGPLTMAKAGGKMEIIPTASSTTGIDSDFIVADDFTIIVDAVNSSYGVVLNGDLSGTPGKTLTINHGTGGSGATATRIRVSGTNTVYNANLNLNDSTFLWACYQASGSQTYNGVISGTGALMQKNSTTYLNGLNTYSGGTTPAAGAIGLGIDSLGSPTVTSGPIGTGPLILAVDSTSSLNGSGQIFASGGARTIANLIQYPSGSNNLTLIIGGTNNLTLSAGFPLNGLDGGGAGTNRTIQVTNTGLTTIAGIISDGSLGVGLIKTGSGVLALNNAETYTGPTTVSAGTLQVNGSLAAASVVTVSSNATLAGTGAINGTVSINAGGALAPGGASIGTLTINNSLSLAGNVSVRINRSGFASDKAVVSGTLANTDSGTVTVTNLGSTLQVGDSFTLFNKALANGGALKITGGGVIWNNQLAVNGKIVVSASPANPPTISYTFSGSGPGSTLTLNWPANYLSCLVQSNSVGIASTNWVTLTNSGNATSFPIVTDGSKTNVFYRLVFP